MRGPVLCNKHINIIYMHMKNRVKKFSPHPVFCKKNIIHIHIKHLGWRGSCPTQFSRTQYHLHTDKKFRAKEFWSCPVSCNKNIIYIHIKNLWQRSSCPAQLSVTNGTQCIQKRWRLKIVPRRLEHEQTNCFLNFWVRNFRGLHPG